jgi:hypothetical protein
MAKGYKTPGSGRVKGTPNKATTERMIANQIDGARAGRIELAKDVLQRAMKLAEEVAARNRPQPANGKSKAIRAAWALYNEWFDRWVFCAKELAKYQSPTFKAVAVMPANPQETINGNWVAVDDRRSPTIDSVRTIVVAAVDIGHAE